MTVEIQADPFSLEQLADQTRELLNLYTSVKADTTGIADEQQLVLVEIRNIADRVESIETKIDKMLELVGAVAEQVTPVIEDLASGPVGRMLGMKAKKSVKGEVESND